MKKRRVLHAKISLTGVGYLQFNERHPSIFAAEALRGTTQKNTALRQQVGESPPKTQRPLSFNGYHSRQVTGLVAGHGRGSRALGGGGLNRALVGEGDVFPAAFVRCGLGSLRGSQARPPSSAAATRLRTDARGRAREAGGADRRLTQARTCAAPRHAMERAGARLGAVPSPPASTISPPVAALLLHGTLLHPSPLQHFFLADRLFPKVVLEGTVMFVTISR